MQFKKQRTTFRRIFILILLIWPFWPQSSQLSIIIGSGLVIIGQIIHFISAGYLVKKDELTTAGPYRFTRNPFYVGNLFYDIGLCVITQNIYVAIIYLPLFYLGVIFPRIRREEAFLGNKFGTAYEAFKQKVPRFIPRLIPAQLATINGQFSWGQIIIHRELWRVLRALGLILIFYIKLIIWITPFDGTSIKTRLPLLTNQPFNQWVLIGLAAIIILPPIFEYLIIQPLRKHKRD
jgi:protein-S-isoprenylcysteine O-methyltransferase Ste14